MCKMRVAVLKENLGQRETGYTLWDGKQVMEQTAKQIKDTIKAGKKVCGLTLDKDGELILDKEGFFTTNLMVHRHSGNYKPLMEEGCMANLFYIVIGSHEENGKKMYECISTRFEQLILTEDDVKAYLRIGMISAGCRLDKDGKIELASLENKVAEPIKVVIEEPKVDVEEKVAEQPKVVEPVKPEVKELEEKVEQSKVAEEKKSEQPKATEPKKEISKKVEKTTK